jgi:anti-sigma factor RsiW
MSIESSHESVYQLLPWYANATLSPEEQTIVEEHLKTCGQCEGELHWLQEVSMAMADLAEEAPPVSTSFARTLAAIDDWEKSKSPAPRNRLAAWFDAIWNPSVPLARIVFAAQLALILLLGVFWLVPRQRDQSYTTLSGSETPSGGARLTVSFSPEATVEIMGQIIRDVGGTIVSGPSASGIYVVELPISPDKDAEVQSSIDKLRINKEVRFVERQP